MSYRTKCGESFKIAGAPRGFFERKDNIWKEMNENEERRLGEKCGERKEKREGKSDNIKINVQNSQKFWRGVDF